MDTGFFAPVAVLVLWTSVVLLWMVAVRWPQGIKLGYKPFKIVGSRGSDMQGVVPDKVMWKSHNYTNLFEQPTIFYAIAIIHGLIGSGGFELKLVWGYVVIRILHSIWQSAVNIVWVRTLLFMVADVLLVILVVRALLSTI